MTNRIIVHVWKNLLLLLLRSVVDVSVSVPIVLAWAEFNSSQMMVLLIFLCSINRTHQPHRYLSTGIFAITLTLIKRWCIQLMCVCVQIIIDNGFNCHRQSLKIRMNEHTATTTKSTETKYRKELYRKHTLAHINIDGEWSLIERKMMCI